jgi:hypothetical protein
MATSQVKELINQLKSIRTAIDRSTAISDELENKYEQLRKSVFESDQILNGFKFSRGLNAIGAAPATLSDRLFMIEFARSNTWGLTDTQKQQMTYVKDALILLQPKLNNLRKKEFPAIKEDLLKAGAPWIPAGPVKEKPDEDEDQTE